MRACKFMSWRIVSYRILVLGHPSTARIELHCSIKKSIASLGLYLILSAPVANLNPAPTTSILSTLAQAASTALKPASTLRPRLTVAQRSTSWCVVSSFATPASTLASVREAAARSLALASSFWFRGRSNAAEYGMMEASRVAEVR